MTSPAAIPLSYPIPDDVSLLPVFRALSECYQRIDRAAMRHIESMGLTPSQFDVLAVLGDSMALPCKDLGKKSLISGGTLTPVVDRLIAKGLVQRTKSEVDSRVTIISLTEAGQEVYERTFLPHVLFMRQFSQKLSDAEQQRLIELLNKLRNAVE